MPCPCVPFRGSDTLRGQQRSIHRFAIEANALMTKTVVLSLLLALPAAAQRYQAPIIKDTAGLPGPRQPIFFRHGDAWRERKPPEWIRIHALPGFVRFPHQRHIKALGTQACTQCHGDVQRMPQVYQVSTLRMGWCVGCHAQNKVSRDCTACHY